MSKLAAGAAGAACLTNLAVAAGPSGAQPARSTATPSQLVPAANEASPARQVDEEIAFRQEMGLPSDRTEVEALLASGQANTEFAFALTTTELVQVRRQFSIQLNVPKWEVELALHFGQERFAGIRIDQKRHGMLVLSLVGPATLKDQLDASRIVEGSPIEFEDSPASLADLGRLQIAIKNDIDALKRNGIDVVAFGKNIEDHSVTVDVRDLSPLHQKELTDTYGPLISVQRAHGEMRPQTNQENPPFTAGKSMPRAVAPGGAYHFSRCTSGFMINYQGSRQALTAGHCEGLNGVLSLQMWHLGSHPSLFNPGGAWCCDVGVGLENALAIDPYTGDVDTDVARISTSQAPANPQNCAWESDSFCRTIVGAKNAPQGGIVYKSGITTGLTFGAVTKTDYSYILDFTDVNLPQWPIEAKLPKVRYIVAHYMEATNITGYPISCGGDSGAAIYQVNGSGGAVAAGILSAGKADADCSVGSLNQFIGSNWSYIAQRFPGATISSP